MKIAKEVFIGSDDRIFALQRVCIMMPDQISAVYLDIVDDLTADF